MNMPNHIISNCILEEQLQRPAPSFIKDEARWFTTSGKFGYNKAGRKRQQT